MLGDSTGTCFVVPKPLAGNVQFFLPSQGDKCTLFSDDDCQKNAAVASGATKSKNVNSWLCAAA